ncbi:winged helix-turn-helix transcriptional regulator [Candidatus Desantisbacteria bacterium]|nr:winged helix-turn-helix transcriptional regulator [Candidatus Desantisbacteria bacterium]
MRDFIFLTKALSDKNRIRIILALKERELCVCQITKLLNLAPSTVSKHLSILNQAYLIESRKEGRWVYYRLANDKTFHSVNQAINWVMNSLVNDSKIIEDKKHLKEILKIDAEELCKTVIKNIKKRRN